MKVDIGAAEMCRLLAVQSVAMITLHAFWLLMTLAENVLRSVLSGGAQKALETNTAIYVNNSDMCTMFW